MLMNNNDAYSRDEILASDQSKFPEKGLFCNKCRHFIPIFSDIKDGDLLRVNQLIVSSRHIMAIEELRSATGCGLLWAKLWVVHSGRPHYRSNAPCPYCGLPLVTDHAKQCDHCFMDWHNPGNVIKLK